MVWKYSTTGNPYSYPVNKYYRLQHLFFILAINQSQLLGPFFRKNVFLQERAEMLRLVCLHACICTSCNKMKCFHVAKFFSFSIYTRFWNKGKEKFKTQLIEIQSPYPKGMLITLRYTLLQQQHVRRHVSRAGTIHRLSYQYVSRYLFHNTIRITIHELFWHSIFFHYKTIPFRIKQQCPLIIPMHPCCHFQTLQSLA
jgi:hypothetical protein